jgi:acetyl esterase/lipase
LVAVALRVLDFKAQLSEPDGLRAYAAKLTPSERDLRGVRRHVAIAGDSVETRGVVTLTPRDVGDAQVLYLHGGGFVLPPRSQHWRFLARLASEARASVYAPLYPLAPAHGYADVIEFLTPIYRELVQSSAQRLVLMGDSAGANIALSLLQCVKEADLPAPSKLILISPPVDLSFGNPLMKALEGRDPLLTIASARAGAAWYAKDIPLGDARISPLFGPLGHLPETQVFVGTNDILMPDVRLFHERAVAEGVKIDYHEGPSMIHCWPLVPFVPEAKAARRKMAWFIEGRGSEQSRSHLGVP